MGGKYGLEGSSLFVVAFGFGNDEPVDGDSEELNSSIEVVTLIPCSSCSSFSIEGGMDVPFGFDGRSTSLSELNESLVIDFEDLVFEGTKGFGSWVDGDVERFGCWMVDEDSDSEGWSEGGRGGRETVSVGWGALREEGSGGEEGQGEGEFVVCCWGGGRKRCSSRGSGSRSGGDTVRARSKRSGVIVGSEGLGEVGRRG